MSRRGPARPRSARTLTTAELDALGVSTDVPTAGRAFGLSREKAYDLAKAGQLAPGVPVIRSGDRYVVPVAPLRRALGYGEVILPAERSA